MDRVMTAQWMTQQERRNQANRGGASFDDHQIIEVGIEARQNRIAGGLAKEALATKPGDRRRQLGKGKTGGSDAPPGSKQRTHARGSRLGEVALHQGAGVEVVDQSRSSMIIRDGRTPRLSRTGSKSP